MCVKGFIRVVSENVLYTQSYNLEKEILHFFEYTETELRFLVKTRIEAYLQSCLWHFHTGWGLV